MIKGHVSGLMPMDLPSSVTAILREPATAFGGRD